MGPRLRPDERIRFIMLLETVLKSVLDVADVQIIVATNDPDNFFSEARDESLLEGPKEGSKDRAS